MTPTLAASRAALPPEGANSPWGGPAEEMTPTLAASRAALPPEGANSPWGGPAANWAATLTFPAELLLRAQGVKVAFFDVDGVLTDGGLYFSEAGESIKRFHTLDGQGLKLLQLVGITPVVITGRDSKPLRLRLQALGIEHAFYGTEDKRPAAEATLEKLGLAWQQAAGMGDDWPDLPVLTRCAFACAPANAHAEVKAVAHHVTALAGGCGAAREFCDVLLVASGHYARLLKERVG